VTYAVEGSIFVAGSAVQWLRDELGIIDAAGDTATIAQQTGIVDNIHVVPAFAGLGAPYWDAGARGAILGLSRDSSRAQIITATLQAIAYQTRDLVLAMAEDGIEPGIIRVDGGMVANDWFLTFLAGILGITVERPRNTESTVLGAAYLAGLSAGLFESFDAIARLWQRESAFEPGMTATQRESLYRGWIAAVSRVRTRD
jgi:glycerol kinase